MISKSARRHENGQALVEFASVTLFLMLLMAGILEVFMMMHTYNVLTDSAKEGVRYAIVHGANNTLGCGPSSCSAITGEVGTGIVKTYAQYSLHDVSNTNMTVNVSYNPGGANGANCNKAPCLVQVTVSYPYQPFFGMGWPSITVQAAAQGRIIF